VLLSSVLALRRMCPIYTTLPRSHLSLATDVRDLRVNIHTGFDQDYGKSLVFSSDPYPFIGLLQKATVIFHLNNAQFNAFYVDLLTRPVPVNEWLTARIRRVILTCNQVTNRRLFGERNITIAPLSRQFPIDGFELVA
jgi:hypothetical protein